MSRFSSFSSSVLFAVATALTLTSVTTVARADDECPPGSKYETEGEFKWCKPTVCETDVQCATGEVCKPVPLCVQIGRVESKPGQDAGSRLIALQRCGEDKQCPNTSVCSSEHSRCVSRAQADKMGGINAKAAPNGSAPSGSAPPAGGEPAKKSCGCSVVGMPGGELAGVLAAAAVALTLSRRSRRSRRR